MTKLVAINTITRKHPGAGSTEVTGYDKNGEAIIKIKSETLKPGDMFDPVDDAQEREILAHGAARPLTDAYLALFYRVIR